MFTNPIDKHLEIADEHLWPSKYSELEKKSEKQPEKYFITKFC